MWEIVRDKVKHTVVKLIRKWQHRLTVVTVQFLLEVYYEFTTYMYIELVQS